MKNQKGNSLIATLVILTLIAGAAWFIYSIFQPTSTTENLQSSGTQDEGQQHVTAGTELNYSTNPPTSGSHYEESTPAGVYQEPLEDGNLVHSLEHGYVIISYNCNVSGTQSFKFVRSVLAHDGESHDEKATATTAITPISDQSCQELINQLTTLSKDFQLWKLIVIPRPSLDTTIALTAWTQIDKFNEFNETRITSFVNAYRNQGPEKTPN